MRIFALSDLHLSSANPKPMDVFGPRWTNHENRLQVAWRDAVSSEDVVIVGGDISWAMTLEEAVADLHTVAALPGRKVLLKGNHDYWWGSLSRTQEAAGTSCIVLQNNAVRLGNAVIAGSRGWSLAPCGENSQDAKIIRRELLRLEMSLSAGRALLQEGDTFIAVSHYPPFTENGEETDFTRMLEKFGVDIALYGHLHNLYPGEAFEGELHGVRYVLTSCDYLECTPKLIKDEQ